MMNHVQLLEAVSIEILREAANLARKPVMLYRSVRIFGDAAPCSQGLSYRISSISPVDGFKL